MNSGSIHNPSTKEGQLFRFLLDHLGQEFTTMELGKAINSWCLHTYKNGVDHQCEALGYKIERKQRGKLHYYKMVEIKRPIPTDAQMTLEMCG